MPVDGSNYIDIYIFLVSIFTSGARLYCCSMIYALCPLFLPSQSYIHIFAFLTQQQVVIMRAVKRFGYII